MDHLKQLVFPTVRVRLPPRSPKPYPLRCARLKSLDNHQEAIAQKYENGHRIFSGPSGCGKTLILVNKTAFLLKYNPTIKRILIVCFNITLVNYLKRLVSSKGLPLGDNGVHVTHFYQLCADILGEPVQFENEDADYYDLVVQSALERLEKAGPRYDAVLVDEGQDFSPDMYRVVTKVLNPKTDNLTIALDYNQNLYRHTFTWSNVGVRARGRTHKLSYVYRSTRELSYFAAAFFLGSPEDEKEGGYSQMELFPDFFDFSGPLPELVRLESIEAICGYVADKVTETVAKDECPFSEVAVLYAKKKPQGESILPVPEMIKQSLAQKGIFSNWVSKDYQQKSTYDITTNSVAISTIYSAKGLDFACVFLIGLDTFDEAKMSQDQIERLTYVGITRARYQLFIPYIKETQVIRKLSALVCRS
jgi:superfamily I DNA and RNA helicase